jgi:transposase-like protein
MSMPTWHDLERDAAEADRAYDEYVERQLLIDCGWHCPICHLHSEAKKWSALRIPMFRCTKCGAEWLDLTKENDNEQDSRNT